MGLTVNRVWLKIRVSAFFKQVLSARRVEQAGGGGKHLILQCLRQRFELRGRFLKYR